MINELLFIEFVFYIASILVGFRIGRKKKNKLNKKYEHYRTPLYFIIAFIFTFVSIFLISADILWLATINILFIAYFFLFAFHQTRCWKQHRMVIYNFFAIIVIHYFSLYIGNDNINFLVLVIYIYNILEFQFAKFDGRKFLIWN